MESKEKSAAVGTVPVPLRVTLTVGVPTPVLVKDMVEEKVVADVGVNST